MYCGHNISNKPPDILYFNFKENFTIFNIYIYIYIYREYLGNFYDETKIKLKN